MRNTGNLTGGIGPQRCGSNQRRRRKSGTKQQRPETENRPVTQKYRHTGTWHFDIPDAVKLGFDGAQQQQRGNKQKHHPDPGQLPRLLTEAGEVIRYQ